MLVSWDSHFEKFSFKSFNLEDQRTRSSADGHLHTPDDTNQMFD